MTDTDTTWKSPKIAADRIAQGLSRSPVSKTAISLLAAVLDVFAITLGLWFAAYLSSDFSFSAGVSMAAAGLVSICVTGVQWKTHAYETHRLRRPLRSASTTWLLALGATCLVLFMDIWPDRTVPFLICAAACLAFSTASARAITSVVAQWAHDFGLTDQNAAIVGGGRLAAAVLEQIEASERHNVRVVGLFDDRNDERSPDSVAGVPKLGSISDLVPFSRQAPVDMVIIAFPILAEARVREVVQILRVLPVDIRLCGLAESVASGAKERADPARLISLSNKPLTREAAFAKRAFDVVVAIGALVVLSPVLLLCAIAIKLDSPGPVFFLQERHGYNNSVVRIFKFRSMYADKADNQASEVVGRKDSRVTRVGRVLRRTSLDELPQLLNVLFGDISLVGPRPHVVNAVYSKRTPFEELVENYAARHRVPPGITGWAQINGWRGEIDNPDRLTGRVEHDLYYIENRSFLFDMYILARTIPALFNSEYAY